NRIHVTEKPLQLMKDVIQICEPGGLILDPFAGAGTTILAAAESGYQAVGIEVTDAYYKLGSDRVRIALEAGAEAENKEPQ
ncbi:MAG: DNA methyltransferase, partial [Blautia sp.]